MQLRNSQYQDQNVTIFQYQCMNRSYSNFTHYHAAIVGNFDTILDNLGIPEDIRMNVTNSLTRKRYEGQISKMSKYQKMEPQKNFGVLVLTQEMFRRATSSRANSYSAKSDVKMIILAMLYPCYRYCEIKKPELAIDNGDVSEIDISKIETKCLFWNTPESPYLWKQVEDVLFEHLDLTEENQISCTYVSLIS